MLQLCIGIPTYVTNLPTYTSHESRLHESTLFIYVIFIFSSIIFFLISKQSYHNMFTTLVECPTIVYYNHMIS